MADNTITLLPCPMCGNRGIFVEREDLCAYQARCDDCGARGPVVEHGDYIEDDGRGVDAARAAWNRRHPQDNETKIAAEQVAPVAWLCEDQILPGRNITQDSHHAERRAAALHEGKPAWRVTPLYAAPPASAWVSIAEAPKDEGLVRVGWPGGSCNSVYGIAYVDELRVEGWLDDDDLLLTPQPTFYHPYPAPPGAEGGR